MLIPLHREDTHTLQSFADYETLTQRTPELPDRLDELLDLLANNDEQILPQRNAVLWMLIECIQSQVPETTSIQLWLLYAFRGALRKMANRYLTNERSEAETSNDVIWCFLETLHRIYKTHQIKAEPEYLARYIVRETVTRIRRSYGWRDVQPKEDNLHLHDLMDTGWDIEQPEQIDYIRNLPISDDDKYLLIGQYIYGYSQKELSEKLGISHAALRQRNSRLLKSIRTFEIEKNS